MDGEMKEIIEAVLTPIHKDLNGIKDAQVLMSKAMNDFMIVQHDLDRDRERNEEARKIIDDRLRNIESTYVKGSTLLASNKHLTEKIDLHNKIILWSASTLIVGLVYLAAIGLHIS